MKSFTGFIGYILVGAFIYLCITKMTTNPALFLNSHGLLIVGGGLVAAAMASFPGTLLWKSLVSVFRSMVPSSRLNPQVAEELVLVARAHGKGAGELERTLEKINSPFLKEAVNLMLEGIPSPMIQEILDKRIEEKDISTQSQMNVMLTLSKYSPALGLAATVLGLVDLLGELAAADMAKLGYGMAIALSATFYGIILSNLVFAPLSEMISSSGEIESREMEMIRTGVQAIMDKKNPLIVGELVNSFLAAKQRIDFTKTDGRSSLSA